MMIMIMLTVIFRL